MQIAIDTRYQPGDLVTLRAMAAVRPARCQILSVRDVIVGCGPDDHYEIWYAVRPIDPPSRWGDGVLATGGSRLLTGGFGFSECEVCDVPAETRAFYGMEEATT